MAHPGFDDAEPPATPPARAASPPLCHRPQVRRSPGCGCDAWAKPTAPPWWRISAGWLRPRGSAATARPTGRDRRALRRARLQPAWSPSAPSAGNAVVAAACGVPGLQGLEVATTEDPDYRDRDLGAMLASQVLGAGSGAIALAPDPGTAERDLLRLIRAFGVPVEQDVAPDLDLAQSA